MSSAIASNLKAGPLAWLNDPVFLGILGAVLMGLGLMVLAAGALLWVRAGREAELEDPGVEFDDRPREGGPVEAVRHIPVREAGTAGAPARPPVELFPEDWGLVGEIPGAVVILFHGRIRSGTREFARQLGLPPEALVGREFKEFVAPEDLLRVVEQIEALDRGRRQRCHLSVRLRAGPPARPPYSLTAVRVPYGGEHMVLVSFSPVLVTAVGPLLEAGAAPAGGSRPAADPGPPRNGAPEPEVGPDTARPAASLDPRAGEDDRAAVSGAAAELLATVSHELQTPLVSVRGYTEMILKGRMGPINIDQERGLKVALRNIDRLIERIDELLAGSRPQPAADRARPREFPLWEVIDEAIDMVQEKTARRGVTITTSYLAGNLRVRADREQIQKVFTNLLNNAIKFNREGGSIRVTVRDLSPERLEVEVRDTGIGIPRHALERVFDRFFRVEDPRVAAAGGTGLGLSIVKSILDGIGCDIRVASEVSVGTAFTFTLPRPVADRTSVPQAGPLRRR